MGRSVVKWRVAAQTSKSDGIDREPSNISNPKSRQKSKGLAKVPDGVSDSQPRGPVDDYDDDEGGANLDQAKPRVNDESEDMNKKGKKRGPRDQSKDDGSAKSRTKFLERN